ncbi:glycosyltransferase family 4 protein [soil metagenome]
MTSVALVHDYLTQRGGAERVVLSMHRAFPDATVHTSLYEPSTCFPGYREVHVQPSPLNSVGLLRRRHRLAFPMLAPAFSSRVVDADVTIVSSSGWAHGVRTTGRKIVYCHAPARWLHQREQYLRQRGGAARLALTSMQRPLRAWDLAAARSADRYIANSTVVRQRVWDAYGIDAEVIHPPHSIDVEGRQRPVPGVEPGYVLCIARLQAYKNVDTVVSAMRQLPGQRLVVVGTGRSLPYLEDIAGPNVRFVSEVSDSRLRWLYANAAVLAAASHEDFGLTPVEAAAFGVPTVALRAGGYLDTVADHSTGLFFDELSADHLAVAIDKARSFGWDPSVVRAHADRFSESSFVEALRAVAGSDEDMTVGRA